jgi:hypothetical protein
VKEGGRTLVRPRPDDFDECLELGECPHLTPIKRSFPVGLGNDRNPPSSGRTVEPAHGGFGAVSRRSGSEDARGKLPSGCA